MLKKWAFFFLFLGLGGCAVDSGKIAESVQVPDRPLKKSLTFTMGDATVSAGSQMQLSSNSFRARQVSVGLGESSQVLSSSGFILYSSEVRQ